LTEQRRLLLATAKRVGRRMARVVCVTWRRRLLLAKATHDRFIRPIAQDAAKSTTTGA